MHDVQIDQGLAPTSRGARDGAASLELPHMWLGCEPVIVAGLPLASLAWLAPDSEVRRAYFYVAVDQRYTPLRHSMPSIKGVLCVGRQ